MLANPRRFSIGGNRAGTRDRAFNAFGFRDTGIALSPRVSNIHIYSAGGSFFPFETMPDWMASFGQLTPNGWALVQFWTDEEDARRQRRRTLEFAGRGRNRKGFWITYSWGSWVPREAGAQVVEVRRDFLNAHKDWWNVTYKAGAARFRRTVRRAA